MAANWAPLTEEEKSRYKVINKENLEFLMNRYNKVNRWVIADMIRRSAYHYPNKPALVYGDKTLTYAELEREGLIESRRGKGLFVAEHGTPAAQSHAGDGVRRALEEAIRAGQAAGMNAQHLRAIFDAAIERMNPAGRNGP